MSAIAEVRMVLSDAVSDVRLDFDCTPYAPDTLSGVAAWIDSVTIDYDQGASFCEAGQGEAVIIAVGLRNDRAGSSQLLEELQPEIVAALENVEGVRVTQVQSGTAEVNGQTLPAVIYTTQFFIS